MRTVTICRIEQFCPYCKETGGEYGTPREFYCMSGGFCRYPGKRCLYVEKGGKRPQDGE